MKVKITERGIERYSELDDGALGVTINFVPHWTREEQLLWNPKKIEPPAEVRVPRGASGSWDIETSDGTYESWLGLIRAALMRDRGHLFDDIN